jgi:hypothetical protein
MTTFLFFVDANGDPIMANDATTSSNPLVTPRKDEKLEEKPFDVNVSQELHKEELIRKVVCIQMVQFVWDRQVFPNPRTLAIYL